MFAKILNDIISSKLRTYSLLFVVTLIFAGTSVIYMYQIAKNSSADNAKLYPASSLGAGGVTFDNVIISKNLIEHRIFSRDTEAPFLPDTWRTPGYPFFVAIFYWLFDSFYPVIIAQIILLFFTSVLIFKMAEKIMNPKWALLPALLYIILPDTLLSTSALFTENTFVFVLVSSFYIFFFSEFKNFYLKFLLSGFLLAISAYIRPASFYLLFFFVPAYFIFYLKKSEINLRQFMAMGLLVLIFLATLLPWYIRNKKEVGVWTFASTSSYVLFRQNGAQFYAALHNIDIISARNALLRKAGIPEGTVPRDTRYSDVMRKVAIEVITENPFRYTLFHLSSFIPFFTSSGANEYSRFVHDMMLPDYNPTPEPSLIQALNPFSFPTLIIVLKNHGWTLVENFFWAIITLFVIISVWKSKNVRLTRMFMIIILYFAIATGPIAHARYRIPVEPLMLISTFSSVYVLFKMYKERKLKTA